MVFPDGMAVLVKVPKKYRARFDNDLQAEGLLCVIIENRGYEFQDQGVVYEILDSEDGSYCIPAAWLMPADNQEE